MQNDLVFVDMKHFFVEDKLFLVWHKTNFRAIWTCFRWHPIFLCNIKLFVSTKNCFSSNTKLLFWTLHRILCHGDIFLLSRCNKNIITCQRQIKFHLCVTQKKSFFVHHNSILYLIIFNFYISQRSSARVTFVSVVTLILP